MAKDIEVNVKCSCVRIGHTVYEDHGVIVGEPEWAFRSRKWAFLKGQKRRINELDEAEREQARPVWVQVHKQATIDLLNELFYKARLKARGEVEFDKNGEPLLEGQEERSEEEDEDDDRADDKGPPAPRRTQSTSGKAENRRAVVSSGCEDTGRSPVWFQDPTSGRWYVKTASGVWGRVKWSRGKRLHPRKPVERHKAAQLDRLLLPRAVAREVEMPTEPPRCSNKLWDTRGRYYTPINLVQCREHPEDTTIFFRREKGPASTDWLEHFAVRILRYCSQRRLWEENQGLKPTEDEEEDQQEESREDAVEEEEF
jgi:hypothetical protein